MLSYLFFFFWPSKQRGKKNQTNTHKKQQLVKEKSRGGDQGRKRHRLTNKFRLFSLKNRKTSSWGHQTCFEPCLILNKQILDFKDFCEYALMNSGSAPLFPTCNQVLQKKKRIKTTPERHSVTTPAKPMSLWFLKMLSAFYVKCLAEWSPKQSPLLRNCAKRK